MTARRKGTTWSLGGMSAKQPRAISLPLAFLGAGSYTAKMWQDAPDTESDPNDLSTASMTLSSADSLNVHLALDGGFVAELKPHGK